MVRTLGVLVVAFVVAACSSSSSSTGGTTSGDGGSGACPDVSGAWKVTAHCDTSLVGQAVTVTEKSDCSLTFSAPFDGFTGSVTADGKITVSGPQTCNGTASPTAIALACTPGTCNVNLGR